MKVCLSDDGKGIVEDGDEEFKVDLGARMCSCLKFQNELLPCAHACAVVFAMREPPKAYIDDCYKAERYCEAYQQEIVLVLQKEVLGKRPRNLQPPRVQRNRGRPKKRRIPSRGEERRALKCSRCARIGHNRRTCREPLE